MHHMINCLKVGRLKCNAQSIWWLEEANSMQYSATCKTRLIIISDWQMIPINATNTIKILQFIMMQNKMKKLPPFFPHEFFPPSLLFLHSLLFLTCEVNLCPHPSTIHLKGLCPPWVSTWRSSHDTEQEALSYTLHPTHRHLKLSASSWPSTCTACKQTYI